MSAFDWKEYALNLEKELQLWQDAACRFSALELNYFDGKPYVDAFNAVDALDRRREGTH